MWREIEAARTRPFSYGDHDCCLFAANVVEAMTGVDPATEWRGRYCSKRGAYQFIQELGGLGKLVSSVFGEPVCRNQVHKGDLALMEIVGVDGKEEVALGVCTGTICYVARHETGVLTVRRDCMLYGWKVE